MPLNKWFFSSGPRLSCGSDNRTESCKLEGEKPEHVQVTFTKF